MQSYQGGARRWPQDTPRSFRRPTPIQRRTNPDDKPYSKSASISVILAHVFISGLLAGVMNYVATSTIFNRLAKHHHTHITLMLMYGSHTITVLRLLFYPLFGFMADVWFGRYRTVVASVVLMILSIIIAGIIFPLLHLWEENRSLITSLAVLAYILAAVGLGGFEANVIQFGLDQLMESGSRTLSFYLHLHVWVRLTAVAIATIPFTIIDCDHLTDGRTGFRGSFRFLPLAAIVFLVIPTLMLVRMRRSFYTELGNINPYKMVVKVMGYVLKNRQPRQRRSAFFYYYGLNPGRLDLAKVHYGGPFTTEDVENVKTVLQILGVILCVGPVFVLEVTKSNFIYQHFVQHLVPRELVRDHCSHFWPLMGSGNQFNLIAVILYPLYTLVIFKCFRNMPKILLRLLLGLVMATLGLVCILLIEVGGHLSTARHSNETIQCALTADPMESKSLDVPWGYLILPNLLYGLATPIIYTGVFEFISAQSPKSMMGLLIGTFFFIVGLFTCLGTVVVVPFTQKGLWKHTRITTNASRLIDPLEYTLEDIEHPWGEGVEEGEEGGNIPRPWVSMACEMWYMATVVVLGALGIAIFSLACRKYSYRKRDENPFSQACVEEIVTRGIEEDENLLEVASVEAERRGGVLSYERGENSHRRASH